MKGNARTVGIHHECYRQTRTYGFLKEIYFVVSLGRIYRILYANFLAHYLAQDRHQKVLEFFF